MKNILNNQTRSFIFLTYLIHSLIKKFNARSEQKQY